MRLQCNGPLSTGRIFELSAGLLILLIGSIFFGSFFSHLFPLIEYRQWISSAPAEWTWPPLREMILPCTIFSRKFSIWVVQTGWICTQHNIEAANWLQLAMLLLTAVGLYYFLRRQFPAPYAFLPALGCAGCYLFSVPLVDAAAWQATNHDKLAALLSILGLHLYLTLSRMPINRRSVILGNGGGFCIAVLAYNSKESAWCLVPAECALILAGRIADGTFKDLKHLRPWKETLTLTSLPLLYSVWHVTIRLLLRLREPNQLETTHIFGGDLPANLYHFLLGFVNLPQVPNTWQAFLAASLILVGITAGLVYSLIRGHTSLLVPMIGFAAAVIIPARTYYASLFYLLVPGLFFWWLLCAAIVELCQRMTANRNLVSGLIAVAMLVLQIVNLVSPRAGWDTAYVWLVKASAGFRASLPQIARIQPIDNSGLISFAYPEEMFFAYRILGDQQNRSIAPFLFPSFADRKRLAAYDARISNFRYSADFPVTATPGAVTFVFDRQLQIREAFGGNAARTR